MQERSCLSKQAASITTVCETCIVMLIVLSAIDHLQYGALPYIRSPSRLAYPGVSRPRGLVSARSGDPRKPLTRLFIVAIGYLDRMAQAVGCQATRTIPVHNRSKRVRAIGHQCTGAPAWRASRAQLRGSAQASLLASAAYLVHISAHTPGCRHCFGISCTLRPFRCPSSRNRADRQVWAR